MTQPSIVPGLYVHRFQGNALDRNETCYYLAGLGTMSITKPGPKYKIIGQQESVHLPFKLPADPEFMRKNDQKIVTNRTLNLDGDIKWDGDKKLWIAAITFSYKEGKEDRELLGDFVFTRTVSKEIYWVMATGLRITKGEDVLLPAEAVSGEVHLIEKYP